MRILSMFTACLLDAGDSVRVSLNGRHGAATNRLLLGVSSARARRARTYLRRVPLAGADDVEFATARADKGDSGADAVGASDVVHAAALSRLTCVAIAAHRARCSRYNSTGAELPYLSPALQAAR